MNNNINDIEENEIDFHKIIGHLKRNLITILSITFIVTSLAIVYAYFLKPVYSSSAIISFSDEKTSKLTTIVPEELSEFGMKKSELETVKLTLMTRKFINSVIQDLDINQHYFIENNFKKNEIYTFKNLDVKIDIHDKQYMDSKSKNLYGELFEIVPIDSKKYLLKVDVLNYSKVHNYNEDVKNSLFNIKVSKKGNLSEKSYFVQVSDKTKLADTILGNMQVNILSDNVIKITYNDNVPRRAKEIVNAISKKFISYTLNKKTSEISKTLAFLDTQISETKEHLKTKGDKLQSYQQKSEIFMPMKSSTTLFNAVSEKKETIKMLELQIDELKNFQTALKKNNLNTVSLRYSGIDTSSIQTLIELFRTDSLTLNNMRLQSKNIEKSLTTNVQLNNLIDELNKQKKLLDELRFNFTPGHPQVIKTSEYISQIETSIRDYISKNIKKLEDSKRLTKTKILNNITMTQNSISSKLKFLKKDLDEKNRLLQSLPKKDLTIQDLKRQFTLSENIYTFLLQKKMELEISKASTIANTQIIEDPVESLSPIKPNRKLIVIIGLIAGLILGILYTSIKALLDTKVRDASCLKALTNIPIYGNLPNKKSKRIFDEALREIRTNIQFRSNTDNSCTTILISSTISGEGKTTIISGLANMISNTGKKVLMMDLDLRKPSLSQEFNTKNTKGIVQYLVQNFELSESIQQINKNLDFLPAGMVPSNPSELLMSDKFNKTIKKLSEQYDYILFDTSPIGSVVDANMLLPHSDIVLFVVRANFSQKKFLDKIEHLTNEKNIKSLGIILNDLKENQIDYYDYDYGVDKISS